MSFLVAACCVHDDCQFLPSAIATLRPHVEVVVFVSKLDWIGNEGDWLSSVHAAQRAGATVLVGSWPGEELHRQTSLTFLKDRGYHHVITFDSDEVLEPKLVETLLHIHATRSADRIYAQMNTYWKTPAHVITPREPLQPLVMLDVRRAVYRQCRWYEGGRSRVLEDGDGILHHLSYVGPTSRIVKKIRTWGHRHEVVPNWIERVWLQWDTNPDLTNLHPTVPHHYQCAKKGEIPECLNTAD